jgi:transposase
LAKYNTVACDYEAESGRHSFATVATTPKALHDLIVDRGPERVVIEICSVAGWICDLVRALEIELQVANTADERWRWRKVKQKNDRREGLKAAQPSAVNQLCPVHVPELPMRQWRALIGYRHQLVGRRTKVKNHVRDLLLREGQLLPPGNPRAYSSTEYGDRFSLSYSASPAQPRSSFPSPLAKVY